MKKLLAILTCVLLLCASIPLGALSVAAATTGTTGDCQWRLDGTTLTIYGNGAMEDYSYRRGPWGNTVTSVIIEEGVTAVGKYAFGGCSHLVEVTLPDSVTSIRENAFESCSELRSVTFGNKLRTIGPSAFEQCYKLQTVVFPDSVGTIAEDAFYSCTGLRSVHIGSGVTSISANAFFNCSSLTEFTVSPGNGYYAVHDGVLYKGSQERCDTLWICPDGKQGSHVIPDTVTSISTVAFGYSSALSALTVPAGVTNLDEIEYWYGTGLTSITVAEEHPTYTSCDGVLYTKDLSTLVWYPRGRKGVFAIPVGVSVIGQAAFSDSTYLTDVVIPDTVTTIENRAFSYCEALTSVVVPDTVTEMGSSVFLHCTSLTSAVIGYGLEYIPYGTFSYCTSLTMVYNDTMNCGVDSHAFDECTSLTDVFVNYTYEYPWWEEEYPEEDEPEDDYEDYSGNGYYHNATIHGIAGGLAVEDWEDSFTYTIEDGAVTITGWDPGCYVCMVIPAYIEGCPVTAIATNAFDWDTHLKAAFIPATVTTIGNYAFYRCEYMMMAAIPDSVTSIGVDAFRYCDELRSINIPDSLTTMGNRAFEGCDALTSVVVPDGVTCQLGEDTFSSCKNLTSVSLPYGITEIGAYMFRDCESLTSVAIPDSVTVIGDSAFDGCLALTEIDLGDGVSTVGMRAFMSSALTDIYYSGDATQWARIEVDVYNDTFLSANVHYTVEENLNHLTYEIVDGQATITGYGYQYPSPLRGKVIIPAYIEGYPVTGLVDGALSYSERITSIHLPVTVTEIGMYAFEGCTALDTVYYGGSEADRAAMTVWSENDALRNAVWQYGVDYHIHVYDDGEDSLCNVCGSMRPDAPQHTGSTIIASSTSYPFEWTLDDQGTLAIQSYDIPDRAAEKYLSEYRSQIRKVVYYDYGDVGKYAFANCPNLEVVEMPMVYRVYDYAFSGCTALQTVSLRGTYLYDSAFRDCTALKTVKIPDTYEIGTHVFAGCTALETVDMGSVQKVGASAFEDCSSLRFAFMVERYEAVTIGERAFAGCTSLDWVAFREGSSLGSAAFNGCTALNAIYVFDYYWRDENYRSLRVSAQADTFAGVTATVYHSPTKYGYGLEAWENGTYGGNLTVQMSYSAPCGMDAFGIYDEATATLTIRGTGALLSVSSGMETWWAPLGYDIRHLVIEDGITEIPQYCFEYYWYLETVRLPNTLEVFSCNAFNDCEKITTMVIPASLKEIPQFSSYFNRCPSLTDLYYMGTEQDLAAIPYTEKMTYYGQTLHCLTFYPATAATCTEEGNAAYYAFDDGFGLFDENKNPIVEVPSIPATGTHTYQSLVTVIPTCTDAGVMIYTCACGDAYTEAIPAVGHTYDSDCDAYCNVCNEWRETYVDHFYDDEEVDYLNGDCDPDCDVCGERRDPPHAFGSDCDAYCDQCGEWRETYVSHVYDNECDTDCNACYEQRQVPAHTYESTVTTAPTCGAEGEMTYTCSACGDTYTESIPATENHRYASKVTIYPTCGDPGLMTYTCSGCGHRYTEFIVATGFHVYDHACDTDCNVCGETRQVSAHVYDNACDTDCNVCGEMRWVPAHTYHSTVTTAPTCGTKGVRTYTCTACGNTYTEVLPPIGDHIYDNSFDADCNVCGTVREVDIPADAPTFVVEDATVRAGDTFTVAIRTLNNSGIVSLKLKVAYDADVLELISTAQGDFAEPTFGPIVKNPFTVNWLETLLPNNTTDGAVAFLTFRVKEGATVGETAITITYDPEDVYDSNFDNVSFLVENGTVNVVDFLYGDTNGDGNVNNKDLGLLQRYINEWDVTLDTSAADVDGNGKVNNLDLGLLQRYLSDWDVELG